jgi:hypothetical protein
VIIPSQIRCAIYTRKSSEEGLEQSFNSLHAQREACEAYILWDKLVSGCISLRTGKFTGNSPFSGPLLSVRYAANPQILWHL